MKGSQELTTPRCSRSNIDTTRRGTLDCDCLTTSREANLLNEFRVTPARQSLGRKITPLESALAEALEAIFSSGPYDPAHVVAELEKRDVRRPSGGTGAWTVSVLEDELREINLSLDAAYQGRANGTR